jgi:hypothetical protein
LLFKAKPLAASGHPERARKKGDLGNEIAFLFQVSQVRGQISDVTKSIIELILNVCF